MIFWPSGISGREELRLAKKSGSPRLLISCFDAEKSWFNPGPWLQEVWIDSDAWPYYSSNGKREFPLELYCYQGRHLKYKWITAPDRIDDPAATQERFATFKILDIKNVVPVWQFRPNWEDCLDDIWEMVENYPMVGIGGCVGWLRLANYDTEKQHNLKRLRELCEFLPKYFHIFGLHDVGGLTLLRDVALSCDSATWVTKAAKRQVFFVHESQGGLRRAPVENVAHSLGLSPDIPKGDLALYNLKTLMEFCANG